MAGAWAWGVATPLFWLQRGRAAAPEGSTSHRHHLEPCDLEKLVASFLHL